MNEGWKRENARNASVLQFTKKTEKSLNERTTVYLCSMHTVTYTNRAQNAIFSSLSLYPMHFFLFDKVDKVDFCLDCVSRLTSRVRVHGAYKDYIVII